MKAVTIKIQDPKGLHMRPAAQMVHMARNFKSKITFCHDCRYADSCSILEVMSLGAKCGAAVDVVIEGPDEQEALQTFAVLFSEGAGI